MSSFVLDQKFLISSRRIGSLREVGRIRISTLCLSSLHSQVTGQALCTLASFFGVRAPPGGRDQNTGQFPLGESPQGVAGCAAAAVPHCLRPPRVLAGAGPPLPAFFSTSSRFREESSKD